MSGAAKLHSAPEARSAYGRLREVAGGSAATALSVCEIAVGLWIVLRPHAAALYAVSAVAIGAALGAAIAHVAFDGEALPCGCFGRAPIGSTGRAALLAGIAVSSTVLALDARNFRPRPR